MPVVELPVSVSRVGLRGDGKPVMGNGRRRGEQVPRGGLADAACRGEGEGQPVL
jgi:hypothetical protein